MQPTNAHTEIAQRYASAWNNHDIDSIMDLHTGDTEYELHGRTPPVVGEPSVRAAFESELSSMPDICFELVSLHGSADHVVFQSHVTGTLSGRPVEFDAIDLLTLRDGLVHHKHTYLLSAR